MNNDGKTPEIRFRGFDGDWETRLLNEIVSISKGTQLGKKFLLETGAYYVLNGGITPSGYTNSYNTEANTISISEGGNSCGFVFFNREKFWSGGHNYTLSELTTDTCYLYHYLKFQEPKIMGLRVGSGLPNVQKSRLEQVVVSFPALEEQRQIGSFFERLDALIARYRRRRDKLSSVKKSLLEKMFPRDGAKVPEIRFEGFGGDWETKKLKELASFSKGSGYSKNDLKESGTPIILYGRLYTQYETVITNVDTYANKTANAVYSQGGEVLVPASGETAEDISIASVVMKSGVLLGGDLNVILPSNNVDSTFLAISITSGAPHYQMSKMAQGKTIVHLHKSNLEEIDFIFPVLAEQRQIGAFFQEIDAALAHSARLLAKLQGVKKSFLSKLFVSSSSGSEV